MKKYSFMFFNENLRWENKTSKTLEGLSMKQIIVFLLSICLALVSLSGCTQTPGTDGTKKIITGAETIESVLDETNDNNLDKPNMKPLNNYTTKELCEILDLSNSYASVLNGTTMLYHTDIGAYLFLDDYKFTYSPLSEWEYIDVSTIDMDGDGNNEVVLQGLYDIIVLREYEGVVYAYGFTFRTMYNLRNNATFSWNTDAGKTYGSAKLQFDGKNYHYIELDRVENAGTENAKYYIEGMLVTSEEMQFYVNQPKAEKVEWYRWDYNVVEVSSTFDGK